MFSSKQLWIRDNHYLRLGANQALNVLPHDNRISQRINGDLNKNSCLQLTKWSSVPLPI